MGRYEEYHSRINTMREQLLASIQKDGILPPFPGIINQLREMIEDPNTGIFDSSRK